MCVNKQLFMWWPSCIVNLIYVYGWTIEKRKKTSLDVLLPKHRVTIHQVFFLHCNPVNWDYITVEDSKIYLPIYLFLSHCQLLARIIRFINWQYKYLYLLRFKRWLIIKEACVMLFLYCFSYNSLSLKVYNYRNL